MDLIDALGLDFATSPDGVICLIVGALIGVIATQVFRGKGLGLTSNIVLGALGGVISGYLFDLANILDLNNFSPVINDYAPPVIAAIVGSVVVLAVASAVRR